MARRLYELPATLPDGLRCVTLAIPDDDDYEDLLRVHLLELARWTSYERDHGKTAAKVARLWALAFFETDFCGGVSMGVTIRQLPGSPCTVQELVAGQWVDVVNLALCSAGITRDAPSSPAPAISVSETAAAGFVAYVQHMIEAAAAAKPGGALAISQAITDALGPMAGSMPKTRSTLTRHVETRAASVIEDDIEVAPWMEIWVEVDALWDDAWVQIDNQWQDWINYIDEGVGWILETIREGAYEGGIDWVEYGAMWAGEYGPKTAKHLDGLDGFIQVCVDLTASQVFEATELTDLVYSPASEWGSWQAGEGWRSIHVVSNPGQGNETSGESMRIVAQFPHTVQFHNLGIYYDNVGQAGSLWVVVGSTVANLWNGWVVPVGTGAQRHSTLSDLTGDSLLIAYSSWPNVADTAQFTLTKLEIDYTGLRVFENNCNE